MFTECMLLTNRQFGEADEGWNGAPTMASDRWGMDSGAFFGE